MYTVIQGWQGRNGEIWKIFLAENSGKYQVFETERLVRVLNYSENGGPEIRTQFVSAFVYSQNYQGRFMNDEQIAYQYVDFIRYEGELVDAYFDVGERTLILCEGLSFEQYRQARINAERQLAEYAGQAR